MRGSVNGFLEPELLVTLRGPNGIRLDLPAIIDTGFSEAVGLPLEYIAGLELSQQSAMPMELADGTLVMTGVYTAAILWDGAEREIAVHSSDGGPLIGMALLSGSRLTIDIAEGGLVSIDPLPAA